MARFIGLDIGTSSTKAVLIDDSGAIVSQVERSCPLSIPKPGWTEQNPADWSRAALECLEALGSDGVEGLGLTGQMHGSVFLDEAGDVIRPALLWNDQRTVGQCLDIESTIGSGRLRQVTGNPALTGFQLPKLLWLRDNEPREFSRTSRVLLPKDYIRHVLCGEALTEPSDASGTGCFDVRQRQFSKDILAELDLDPELFPRCVESAASTGTWKGMPIAAGGGDQAAGAIGTGAIRPGTVSISLGTSGVVFEAFDEPPTEQTDSIHNFCHATGRWHRMGVMLSCGGAVSWANRVLYGSEADFASWTAEAEAVIPGSEGLAFLPNLAGERSPFVDPFARGAWAGLASHHTRGHLARSVLEGVCFSLRQCVELMCVSPPSRVRVTGGGARSHLWLQILSDVLQCPVETLGIDEGPSFGAAILAGVAGGHWRTVDDAVAATVKLETTIEPRDSTYEESFDRHKRLQDVRQAWSAAGSGLQ